jgi:hypothetical protein
LAAGDGGTGKMISDAIFQSFATFIQSMIIKNGLGVPSCPAYYTVMFIGAQDSAISWVNPTTLSFEGSGVYDGSGRENRPETSAMAHRGLI